MFCKTEKSSKFYISMLVVGILLFALGIIKAIMLPDTAHLESRIMGMLTGLGGGIAGFSIMRLIQLKVSSPEKLKQKQIEKHDERNIQLARTAYTISSMSATLMFAGLVFLFTMMGSITESYICLGALLLQSLIFFVSYGHFEKKM